MFGLVVRSPAQPVCVAGKPCSAPAAGAVLVFARHGDVVARAKADRRGRYRVALRAGRYSVSTRGVLARIRPTAVVVTAGTFTRRNFTIDPGIR